VKNDEYDNNLLKQLTCTVKCGTLYVLIAETRWNT